jgi:hypothetical protein
MVEKQEKKGRFASPVPPSISESSGIPKRKKLFPPRRFRLRPAVHRATIYCCRGLALKRLRRGYEGPGCHAGLAMVSGDQNRQNEASSHRFDSMTPQKPLAARAQITPAGLMFLAITSIGWGFNWPVTKYLLGELPPLTMRGSTGVVGAALLAGLAILSGQSLRVPRKMWLRLVLAALLNVACWMTLMGLALLWLPASEAALIVYTMPVMGLDPGLADSRRAAEPVARDLAGDGVRGACRHHGRQRLCGKQRKDAGDRDGAGRRPRLCGRHRARQEIAAGLAAAFGCRPRLRRSALWRCR